MRELPDLRQDEASKQPPNLLGDVAEAPSAEHQSSVNVRAHGQRLLQWIP
jgi:hypothetical protein